MNHKVKKAKNVANGRPKTLLARTLEERLAAYALCAGAAGVGMLALAQPAKAQIIYTPVHVVINPGASYSLDFANNGISEFRFVESSGVLYVQPPSFDCCYSNKLEATSFRSVDAVNLGAEIGPSQQFSQCSSMSSNGFLLMADADHGKWINVRNRYVGAQFPLQRNGETHYGWARFSVRVRGSSVNEITVTALLTGYAYEATPNKPIRAGQTSETSDDVTVSPQSADPETPLDVPSENKPISQNQLQRPSLGLLALGSPGLDFWRTKRSSEPELSPR